MVNKIRLSYGDPHIELTFLQLAIITSPKKQQQQTNKQTNKKPAAISIVLIIQHRIIMRNPLGTVIRNAGAGGRKIYLFLEKSPKKHFEDEILAKCVRKLFVVKL